MRYRKKEKYVYFIKIWNGIQTTRGDIASRPGKDDTSNINPCIAIEQICNPLYVYRYIYIEREREKEENLRIYHDEALSINETSRPHVGYTPYMRLV